MEKNITINTLRPAIYLDDYEQIKWDRNLLDDRPNIGTSLQDALVYRSDKTKAFDEGLQEFYETAIDGVIGGIKYKLHPNINLYCDMTSHCCCDCEFCIAKVDFERCNIDIVEYLNKLIRIIKSMQSSIYFTIQITGGEPTTLPAGTLMSVINIIEKYNIPRPVLNTNGFNIALHKEAVNRFEHINLSRHHYNDKESTEIMKFDIPNERLHQIGRTFDGKVRVQCNMVGNYIDTYGEVMQFLAYAYHYLGATNVAFAELTPLPRDDYYRSSIIDYVEERPVDIDGILRQVGKNNHFKFKKYRGGVACYYEVWEYVGYDRPMTVIFKFSNNEYLKKVDDTPGYLPDLVLHTNGDFCGSWNRNKKHLEGDE